MRNVVKITKRKDRKNGATTIELCDDETNEKLAMIYIQDFKEADIGMWTCGSNKFKNICGEEDFTHRIHVTTLLD